MRPGYKQTEVGVIPSEWKVVSLSETAKRITRGASPRPIDSPVWFDPRSSVGWVRISDVTRSGRYLYETTQRLSEAGIRNSRPVASGSLIMSICATVGRPIETRIDSCIHDGFVVFERPTVDQAFLYHVLAALEPTWSGTGQTGSQMNLNTGLINGRSIALPPTSPEQHAIATALSDVDDLLAGLDRLIAKKRDLKQATMQQLLTGQTRLPGFEGGWEVKSLGDVADVIDPHPSHRAPAEVANGIPFVGIGDLDEAGGIVGTSIRLVSPLVLEEHATRYNLHDQLIGLGRVASIGKVVPLKPVAGGYAVSPTLGVIRGRQAKRDYLIHALKSRFVTEQFTRIMSGSTRSSVGMEALRELQVNLPASGTEQDAIATVLSDMDAELSALKARRDKTRALKQAMMQELLTGRTRLV